MSERRITHIPVPGSSGQTPTGAMQFQNDWPGLFIRGDEAISLLGALRQVEQLLRQKCKSGLPWKLSEVAEIIERDVIVRSEPPAEPPVPPDRGGR
jgi:hypothetical protein